MSNEIFALKTDNLPNNNSLYEVPLKNSNDDAIAEVTKQENLNKNVEALNTEQVKVETSVKETSELAESLKKIMESRDSFSIMQGRQLMFDVDNDSGDYVIKVIDKNTDDVIRQIPSEEFIRIAEKIKNLSDELNSTQGLLFYSKV
jgi:flagellar protein FlaG